MVLPVFPSAGTLTLRDLRQADRGPYDLQLPPGTCALVTGRSGAGKSRLLRMVADLDPHEGQAWLGEHARDTMPAPVWRRQVCYVPAEPGWWDDSVRVHFPHAELAAPLLARLGLPDDILDAPVARLSTGERQRLALLRALSPSLRCLLLDEPTAALDPDTAQRVVALLQDVKAAGVAILLVTHHPGQFDALADVRHALAPGGLERQQP